VRSASPANGPINDGRLIRVLPAHQLRGGEAYALPAWRRQIGESCKLRGMPRVDDRRVLNGIFWVQCHRVRQWNGINRGNASHYF
jgi:hypothetical protein